MPTISSVKNHTIELATDSLVALHMILMAIEFRGHSEPMERVKQAIAKAYHYACQLEGRVMETDTVAGAGG
jgi:hypothetical protein